MSKRNERKQRFLSKQPDNLVEDIKGRFQNNICFSLQFFDNSQDAGQDFSGWSKEQLLKLIEKLKHYCGEPLSCWQRMQIGHGRNHVLEIYPKFPSKSDFEHPKFVPLDVVWARFRLEDDMRIVGFFVNKEICEKLSLNPNIFYIVFLDAHHKFYKT